MISELWNPWHGCQKYSEGCANCYVYRRDHSIGKDASLVSKNAAFDLPVRLDRSGKYKIPSGRHLYVCMTSDFFLADADCWRPEVWSMIRERSDVFFTILTKRINRFTECAPPDWGNGWPHVSIVCTIENQKQCDLRFPIYNNLPIRHKAIAAAPLLGPMDMRHYLSREITRVVVGGESGPCARICDYDWVLDLREQCRIAGVHFSFQQTGALLKKDGRIYRIPRKQQHEQARKAMLNF